LEKEKKLAAQLITQKAAQKQLKINRTQATKRRQSSATSISQRGIIGQKRRKVT